MTARASARARTCLRAVLAATVSLAACAPQKSTEAPPAPAPAPRVVFQTSAGPRHAVTVEIARTPDELERGLMYRTALPAEAGMLFVFPETGPRSFWMKNTFIPLDMIFVDEALRVVAVLENAAPHTTEPRDPGVPARYVVEVNAGWARAHGVGPGAKVIFERVF